MNILHSLALPENNDKMVSELVLCKSSYDTIENLHVNVQDKNHQKKKILIVAFECISAYFDLDYDIKIKFIDDDNEDNIYIENACYKSFNENLYVIFTKCFCKYLDKLHTFKNNRIDEETYSIAKLAYLNKDKDLIYKLINKTYLNVFDKVLILNDIKDKDISNDDITRIEELNNKRNDEILNSVLNYKLNIELGFEGIKNIYKCFSNDIFSKLNGEEKRHICAIFYNYFTYENKINSLEKLQEIDNETSSEECFNIIIDKLMTPGRTMNILQRNKSMLNDVLSGLSITYSNETKKVYLNNFSNLNKLKRV